MKNIQGGAGGGVIDVLQDLLGSFILFISNQLLILTNFILNNLKSVVYHLMFFISYVVCFSVLFETNSEYVRFFIFIFFMTLHIIFLFVVLTANIVVPSIQSNENIHGESVNSIILYSPYFFSLGWLFLFLSLIFIVYAYSNLYYTYAPKGLDIQFGALNDAKITFMDNLYASCRWMWLFYIFERVKIVFLLFFTYNQLASTLILIFGVIFTCTALYTMTISYGIAQSVRKMYLPPVTSFHDLYLYLQDITNNNSAYNAMTEGFDTTTPSMPFSNLKVDATTPKPVDVDSIRDSNVADKMLASIGFQSNDLSNEDTTGSAHTEDYCANQSSSSTQLFLLGGNPNGNKNDLYYITMNEDGAQLLVYPAAQKYKSASSKTRLPFLTHQINGTILLDKNNDMYYIQTTHPQSTKQKVTVSIFESRRDYQIIGFNGYTSLGTGGIGNYLLAPDNNDLVFVKMQGTTTNSVEIYILSAESKYEKVVIGTGTPFLLDGIHSCTWTAPLDTNNPIDTKYMNDADINPQHATISGGVGVYLMADNRDLYFIKNADTLSNMIEIHGLSAASNYQSFCLHSITSLKLLAPGKSLTSTNQWASFGLGTFLLGNNNNLCYVKPTNNNPTDTTGSFSIFTLSSANNYKKFI